MIDKIVLRDILIHYGLKYWELSNVVSSFEKGEIQDDKFFECSVLPGRLFIEPTNRCNKHCVYCARDSMSRVDALMPLSAFNNIIKKIPRGLYITMTGNGEPLLNIDVYEMIRRAREIGLLVGIITNGTLLTEKNSKRLLEANPNRVQISFDAVDKGVYDAMYNAPTGALSYNNVLRKILRYIYIARKEFKSKVFITIASVLTDEVKRVREYSSGYWGRLPVDNYYEGPLLSLQTNSSSAGDIGRRKKENWKPCCNPWTSMKINSDGTVNPCVQDFSSQYVIGNINEDSLESIVNSEKAIALRKALYYKDLEFFKDIGYNCHECNAWQSDAQHDIKGYLNNSYPITYGLVIREVLGSVNAWGEDKIKCLEKELGRLDLDEYK